MSQPDGVTGDGLGRTPAPLTTLLGDQQQRDEPNGEGCRTAEVNAVVEAGVAQVQRAVHHEQGRDAEGHVDQEHPPPAGDAQDLGLAGEEAADDRAQDAGGAEDGQEVALVLGTLTWRDDVPDDGQGQGEEATGTHTLDGSEARQHRHRGGEGAEDRAEQEDHDGRGEERLAAVDVRELAVQRRHDRRGDEVGRDNPGLSGKVAEVVGDDAHGRGDDRLVERGQEHPQHQAGHDGQDLRVGQRPMGGGRWCSGGGGHYCSLLVLSARTLTEGAVAVTAGSVGGRVIDLNRSLDSSNDMANRSR
jgi:hypothetical protein